MSLQTFTTLHVIISAIGLISGAVVLYGLLKADPLPAWTAIFLISTLLTTVTGFFFPIKGVTPALAVGILSTPLLALAVFAVFGRGLKGSWRWIYVVTAVGAFYFNVVALIAQGFLKVPSLHALAPTGSEPAFLVAQAIGLVVFVVLGVLALFRFHPHIERMTVT